MLHVAQHLGHVLADHALRHPVIQNRAAEVQQVTLLRDALQRVKERVEVMPLVVLRTMPRESVCRLMLMDVVNVQQRG